MQEEKKCPFADLLGKPGEGIHKYRIAGYAAADILITLAVAYIIQLRNGGNYAVITLKLLALGILLHKIFGVKTTLNEQIFKKRLK